MKWPVKIVMVHLTARCQGPSTLLYSVECSSRLKALIVLPCFVVVVFSAGLLAGLWEFPALLQAEKNSDVKEKKALCAEISRLLGTRLTDSLLQYVGEVSSSVGHTSTCTSSPSRLMHRWLAVCRWSTSSPTSTRPTWFTVCVCRTRARSSRLRTHSGSTDLLCRRRPCPQEWKRFGLCLRSVCLSEVSGSLWLTEGELLHQHQQVLELILGAVSDTGKCSLKRCCVLLS